MGAETLADLLPNNSIARAVVVILIIFFGWQGRGFITAFREDKRAQAHDEVDLLEMVERVTATKMQAMSADLDTERDERRKLARRVTRLERRNQQLELFIESKNLTPPDWPSHLKD